jgi:hypothetical protein
MILNSGSWLGFGGKEAKTMMKDWCFEARNGKWQLIGCPFDLDESLNKVL